MPFQVHAMHAGEEVLFVLVPIFIVLVIVDLVKRRRSATDEQSNPDGGVTDPQDHHGEL